MIRFSFQSAANAWSVLGVRLLARCFWLCAGVLLFQLAGTVNRQQLHEEGVLCVMPAKAVHVTGHYGDHRYCQVIRLQCFALPATDSAANECLESLYLLEHSFIFLFVT